MNPLLLWAPVALFIAVIAARVIRDCTKPVRRDGQSTHHH